MSTERIALAEGLLEAAPVLNSGQPEALITQLPHATTIRRSNMPMEQAGYIIDHCMGLAHGFEELVDAIAPYLMLENFCELLDRYRSQAIPWYAVWELKQKLDLDIDPRTALNAIKKLRAEIEPPPSGETRVFQWTIEELAKLPVNSAQQQPLLQFVAHLRPDFRRQARVAVDEWLAGVSANCKLRSDTRFDRDDDTDAVPYLMIVVRERPGHRSYMLAASLVYTETVSLGSWEVPEFASCREYIDQICSEALIRLNGQTDDADRMVVQIFLPDELLACDIDRWMSRLSGLRARPLGVELPVTVRSTARVYDASRYGTLVRVRWMRKWRRRMKPPAQLSADDVFSAHSAKDLANLFDKLEDDYVAFAAAIAVSHETAPQAIADIIDSGVPVAIWSRCERKDNVETDEGSIRSLLCSVRLNQVPEQLRQSRKQAFKSGQSHSVFCDVVLLWDDPERIPADSPLALSNEV